MQNKNKYTLDDFDLLVAKASFLMNKIKDLTKDRQDVIDEITELMVETGHQSLETTCGQRIKLFKNLNIPVSRLPYKEHDALYEWCKEHDLVTINSNKLTTALNNGLVPPITLHTDKLRAKFVSQTPVNVLINFEKETIKSWKNTTPEKRNPHMRQLRDAGATFTEIGKIYKISPTQVARILKKKDVVKKTRNNALISVSLED